MSTCQEVITDALCELGVIGEGDEPTPAALANAMPVLQSLYDGLVASGMFGRAVDVLIDANHELEEGERVFNTTGGALTVTTPETIPAEDTDDGVERAVRDYTLGRVAGDPAQTFIYCAPLGAWRELTSLALSDVAPLAERDFHGLSCLLATRLARRFKADVGQTTVAAASRFTSLLSLKLDAPRVSAQAEYY